MSKLIYSVTIRMQHIAIVPVRFLFLFILGTKRETVFDVWVGTRKHEIWYMGLKSEL